METPVTIASWDPSVSAGRPQGDPEDESGGLQRFTPAERRRKKAQRGICQRETF